MIQLTTTTHNVSEIERVRFFDTKTRPDRKRFPCSVAFTMYILFSDPLNLCLELYFAFLLFLDYEADNEAKAMFGDSEEDGKGN